MFKFKLEDVKKGQIYQSRDPRRVQRVKVEQVINNGTRGVVLVKRLGTGFHTAIDGRYFVSRTQKGYDLVADVPTTPGLVPGTPAYSEAVTGTPNAGQ